MLLMSTVMRMCILFCVEVNRGRAMKIKVPLDDSNYHVLSSPCLMCSFPARSSACSALHLLFSAFGCAGGTKLSEEKFERLLYRLELACAEATEAALSAAGGCLYVACVRLYADEIAYVDSSLQEESYFG